MKYLEISLMSLLLWISLNSVKEFITIFNLKYRENPVNEFNTIFLESR